MKNKIAFTLVELIVVISILAILGTISFISFQSYSSLTRDTVRLSNLKIIESGLNSSSVVLGRFIRPDELITISANNIPLRQQGFIGDHVISTARVSQGANIDPRTDKKYDYVVSKNGMKYQLGAYFENEQTDNSGLYVTLGNSLGMVFQNDEPLHRNKNSGYNLDIKNTSNQFTINFSDNDQITSSNGSFLFSNIYNRSSELLRNIELAKLDDYLLLMIDSETMTPSGQFKDFSKNGFHMSCQDPQRNIINCSTQEKEKGWKYGTAFKLSGGAVLKSPLSPLLTLDKNDSFTYFMTVRFFNEQRAPLITSHTEESCGSYVRVTGGRSWAHRNFLINKENSYNLWFMCDSDPESKGKYRVADTIGAGNNFYSPISYKKGVWYNIVATYDAENNYTQKGYLNGRLLSEYQGSQWTGNGDLTKPLHIGREPFIDTDTGGGPGYSRSEFIVDDFRLYNRALSQRELETMYKLYSDK